MIVRAELVGREGAGGVGGGGGGGGGGVPEGLALGGTAKRGRFF